MKCLGATDEKLATHALCCGINNLIPYPNQGFQICCLKQEEVAPRFEITEPHIKIIYFLMRAKTSCFLSAGLLHLPHTQVSCLVLGTSAAEAENSSQCIYRLRQVFQLNSSWGIIQA
jgi:hypothetical protein